MYFSINLIKFGFFEKFCNIQLSCKGYIRLFVFFDRLGAPPCTMDASSLFLEFLDNRRCILLYFITCGKDLFPTLSSSYISGLELTVTIEPGAGISLIKT